MAAQPAIKSAPAASSAAKKSAATKKIPAKRAPAKTAAAKKSADGIAAVKSVASKKAAAKKVAAKKVAAKKASAKVTTKKVAASSAVASAMARATGDRNALMVRMYRVGFGDFFLITVPTRDGPQYVLVDCGVHAGNLGSIGACVEDLAELTQRRLALIIVTHKHADHLSGFATQAEAFNKFEVESVWITNRLDPNDAQAIALDKKVVALATQVRLQLQLAARADDAAVQAMAMAENALGAAGGSNDRAIEVVTNGFANTPKVSYYEAGDEPELPKSLQGALTARILGPAPKDVAAQFSASDNKVEQYLNASERNGVPDTRAFDPFERRWPATAKDYPDSAFRPWASSTEMEDLLHKVQPDALAAAAASIDGTLNNQSLVVLFTCKRKNLLFVGDAQWGNWAYWLYGKPVAGKAAGLTAEARSILGSVDFYKVGHHGSTNSTPVPVVGALKYCCVGMCSTDTGYPKKQGGDRLYGNVARKTEVPRIQLMEELLKQTNKQLVRSDWLPMGLFDADASPEALSQMDVLPPNFVQGPTWIEYVFP
jgi:beta-lactamase superfamily II metal-dependent hydrolase